MSPDESNTALAALIAGRYRVGKRLGAGGMGVVVAAFDTAVGRQVALKRLSSQTPRHVRLFEREFRALASLRHPRIVEVHDYGVDADGPFYTMELLEGADLTGAAPMPWREACLCLRDLASILGVLHARRLVHRDPSPRNLWRTPEGRLKLLDFGALCPFGPATEVMGTPPLVPPEVLYRHELDPRSDLYALGALGYWLLTGKHAFRARALDDLPRLWEQSPPHPSSVVGRMEGALPAIPEALDRLILSLLSLEKAERPAGTVEVIDHLNVIADLEPESEAAVATGYLDSTAFVGRSVQLRSYSDRLALAEEGRGQALLVEGPEGMGRSRLLSELALAAQLRGVVVLRARAADADRPYGGVRALALELLAALPGAARAAAVPHAPVLGHLSTELRRALGDLPLAGDLRGSQEERVRKHAALAGWFLEVSREHTLAVFADDLPALDEDSQAFLAALAHAAPGHRLLLAATRDADAAGPLSAAVIGFRDRACVLRLDPLDSSETRELLRSAFGPVPHLERVAARLHELSEGNPRYCLMLAQHLVRTGLARYVEGSWVLPQDVPDEGLPSSVRAGLLSKLEHLSAKARALAQSLAVPDRGPATEAMCIAAGHGDAAQVRVLLQELCDQGILRPSSLGYRFAHPALENALHAELSERRRAACHAAFGGALEAEAGDDPVLQLRACLHWLRAGELARAQLLLAQAARAETQAVTETLRDTAPLLAEAVELLGGAGVRDRQLLMPLAALCRAAYYVDPRYAARFADRAIGALERVLYMRLARRLRPLLGRKIGLFVALGIAGLRLRTTPHAPDLKHTVHLLLVCAAVLGGVATTCLEPERARRYAELIEPLTALGRDHVASVSHQAALLIAMTAEERAHAAHAAATRLRDWLEGDQPIRGLWSELRESYAASVWFIHGLRGGFRDGEDARVAADRLDRHGATFQLNASQLRAMYYAQRGDHERSSRHREQMEVQAIQQGTAWRIDTFAPLVTMPAIWSHDAVALKRAAEQLERLSADLPPFAYHARSARAAYHVLRGKPQAAVDLLEGCRKRPLSVVGWSRTRSILAAALNDTGQHTRAKGVCEEALGHMTPEDLEFVGLNLNLQAELAVAEAGLGDFERACWRLDGLLARHAGKGPLVRGYLHRTRASVALRQQDFGACQAHVDACKTLALQTTRPSLVAAVRQLEHRLRLATGPLAAEVDGTMASGHLHVATRVQLVLQHTPATLLDRVQQILQLSAEITRASSAYFVHARDEDGYFGLQDSVPDAGLLDWARERLGGSAGGEDVTARLADGASRVPGEDPNQLCLGGTPYCLKPFWGLSGEGEPTPIGALVLGFEGRPERLPPPEVLAVMSDYLADVVRGAGPSGPARPTLVPLTP